MSRTWDNGTRQWDQACPGVTDGCPGWVGVGDLEVIRMRDKCPEPKTGGLES